MSPWKLHYGSTISMAHHQHLYITPIVVPGSQHPRFLGWTTTEYSTLDASLWKRASGCTGRNPNPPRWASTSRTCAGTPPCAAWNLPSQPRSQSAPKATEAAVSRTGSGGATGVAPDRGDLRHASVQQCMSTVTCWSKSWLVTNELGG